MIFRFTLTNEIGEVKVITDPSGWDTASIGFMRDKLWWGLDEVFKSNFLTWGIARDWILLQEKTFGPDGLLKVDVDVDPNDDVQFESFYPSAQIPLALIIESLGNDGHLLQINFTPADFWTRFKNRFNSPVDIRSTTDLDGNVVTPTPKFTLPLPSQKIPKSYKGFQDHNSVFLVPGPPGHQWIFLVGFDNESISEITQKSNITFDISVSDTRAGAISPQDQAIPFFNFDDDGVLDISKLKFTLSEGYPPDDPAYNAFGFIHTESTKLKSMSFGDASMNFYLQKNNEDPIPFSKSDRNVSATFNRNVDGVLITNANITVTDFEFAPQQLIIKKGDFIRIFGIRADPDNYVWYWGKSGWAHDSALDSIIYSQGSQEGPGGSFLNQNHISFGGYFDASLNTFPITIDNDAGVGQAIQSENFWLIARAGVLGGVPVDETMVITARVNNPANIIGDWYITPISYYEGLEAYGMADNGFECLFNTTAKDSITEAFLTHDVASGIIDRITGQSGLFYSEYFGNSWTSRIYDAIGCGSKLAKMKGLHLRGYPLSGDPDPNKNKPYFGSMQDWFEEEYPVHFIGIGYEKKVIDDVEQDIIRCETLDHFFPDEEPVVFLSNVFFIKRSYDTDHQFNSAKIGFAKWQSQAATGVGTPSGIDDAQTVHTYVPRLKKIGKEIVLLSKMIMASLTLETTRRIGNLLSANYTYDNDTFGIAVERNITDDGFTPELDENFNSITNLSNSETRYNSRYTPARNFLRGLNYLSGALQNYLTSVWRFVSGEGNYVMTSTMTTDCPGDDSGESVAENGDIPVSSIPLFVPMPYEIDHELTWEQYKTLRANKYFPIGVSQTEADYKKFYIKSCERIVGTGLFKLIAWPKTLDDAFDIVVDESSGQIGSSRRHESRFEPRYD